ncbi:MAG TPA: magnesium transporter [Planctomycetota bacterium]|nr:magnesium transporter [Planctomycetota bacterium]
MEPETLTADDLRAAWPVMSVEERLDAIDALATREANPFFLSLPPADQAALIAASPPEQGNTWLRLLPPDDAADLLQSVDPAVRQQLLAKLDPKARSEVTALLAFAADRAGGLMSPRFARLRAEATVGEALHYLRAQVRENPETIYYAYVLDDGQRLLGVVSLRELFVAADGASVRALMHPDPVHVRADTDRAEVARILGERDLLAVPVVEDDGRMRGIVTFDDVADAVQQENTEDMQKLGGVEALQAPYLQVSLLQMLRKRAGWLAILFVSEMLTASAMARYDDEIAKAAVLAIFVPLIISSGGNSGSQATTLVIRALALGELRLADVGRVLRREIVTGLLLGVVLGSLGLLRIGAWQAMFGSYGEHWGMLGLVVALSVIGVVAWGAVVGAGLPFLLKRLRLDPASASAPFVATLVDVSGLIIYFNIAWTLLRGRLL